MQLVFCTQLFTEKHVYFTTPDDVMTLILFKFLYCSFMTKNKTKQKKKKKKNNNKKTVNVLKVSTNCFLFLQIAYQCSCSPRTYVVEVVPEHLYMSRLKMTKTNKMTVRPAKTQSSLGIRPVWSESSLCVQWVATSILLIVLHLM